MAEAVENLTFEEEFTLSVQKKFLMLMIYDKNWTEINGLEIIKPEYFENHYLKNLCKWIHTHYRKYKTPPSELTLSQEAQDFVNNMPNVKQKDYWQYKDIITEIYDFHESDNMEYWKDKAAIFARQVRWRQALAKGSEVLRLNNYEEALAKFQEVLDIGTDNNLGVDFAEQTVDEFVQDLSGQYDHANMIRTGLPTLDRALGGGFVRNNLSIVAASPGSGKAVAVNTPVLTPDGWKKAGEIKVGDYLIGRNGKPTKVLGVFPQGISNNYKVIFNDKSETNCCIDHLWSVYDTKSHHPERLVTLSLGEILNKGLFKPNSPSRVKTGRKPAVRWKIPFVEPVEFEEKEQFIPAYTMGALLGDGCITGSGSYRISNPYVDIHIKERIEKELPAGIKIRLNNEKQVIEKGACPSYSLTDSIQGINRIGREIGRLNLHVTSSHKFIPDLYKFGSVQQRIDLLHGLMDTDGSATKGNKTSYSTMSKQLALDIVELVQSLGGMAACAEKLHKDTNNCHGGEPYIYYEVRLLLNKICPFSLPRKAQYWHETNRSRYIADVVKQEDVDSVCFKVDAEDELFVIEHYIVTHNSRIMAFFTKQALMTTKKVIFITLELDETETMANIRTSMTGLTVQDMLNKENLEEFKKKTAMFKNQFSSDLVVKFYKPATVNADTLQNYIHKVIQKKSEALGEGMEWKPDFIVVDYMDKLLPIQKAVGRSYEDMGAVANDLKNLAITFNCAVLTGSQLGKYSWNVVGDDVVSMDSIAESAAKVHLAHAMITINSNPAEKSLGKCRLFTAKSRSGLANKVIYVNYDIGHCNVTESEPWDPKLLEASAGYTVRSSSNSGRK